MRKRKKAHKEGMNNKTKKKVTKNECQMKKK